ncbi:sugar-phosphate isomerase, RpiB/LacA/LacB family [Thermoanaerobacter mathranii subsp. mathranii str. A3]|jgi:ribose 5-phosphate isomerase B|uniref:Sugar-phosphate isomerase, RpiB/LacA/LacB family n=1 Tax=Thermoanaerobacter mathranii subsp. mathranii (strain DSM 11426 / CCUG 53645 / CIP 108742 / A3) TaxID=583358 RepID=A0ABM5LNW3_THEM3|nr:ribose 5-phosphate isomerase B [Thermoanaerobacter mathranii]ADH60418.1 sugar-phosphate isomerase, RpiB/LacA/LacB family [Thermoanaerobacter mathranii subsp. mathranii str. A3]
MRIGIGNDHVGYALKLEIAEHLKKLGHEVVDFGHHSTERTDYPIYAKMVADAVTEKKVDCGILICGTGVGMAIAANKVGGIRAVVCSEPYSAKLSKQHNNTNILTLGARVVGSELAKMIVEEWLGAEYEAGRHARRLEMIEEMEKRQR